MKKLYSVLLPLRFDHPFTYEWSGDFCLQKGQLVKVSFRNKEFIGIVLSEAEPEITKNLKTIIKVYEGLNLSSALIKFIHWVSEYNLAPLGLVLKMILGPNKHFDRIVKLSDVATDFKPSNVKLDKEQLAALNFVQARLHDNSFSVTVLEGITGSGKTEVYLKAVEEIIASGNQVLVLLPEIVLTTQLMQRFEERLSFKPFVWHSDISIKQKKICWNAAESGAAKFIVGARSALFLPFKSLKLIVLDEEHDNSYKQEEGVVYNARDMAVVRSKLEDIPLILASATPSLETIYNIKEGKYHKAFLSSRYGKAVLPEMKIIDLNKEQMEKGKWISPTLREGIANILAANYQSLLFLNRRGYASITYCANCKSKVECPNCNFWMVEHRKKATLQCHYCGHSIPKLDKCLKCGCSEKILALGPGVERIEEEVKEYFPQARTAVFTSDTVENHKQAEAIINSIQNHEIDIVIGTQMTAKGLHFPKLNLVGVIEADKNLIGGDIRTLERTYQLLHQVAGRAGREEEKGIVLIQTYEPDSVVLENLVSGDHQKFYEAELLDREEANMPPFSNLAILTLQSFSERLCLDTIDKLSLFIPEYSNIEIFGPAPAPIFMIKNKCRYRFIVKTPKSISIQNVIRKWVMQVKIPPTVKLKIDINPYSFL